MFTLWNNLPKIKDRGYIINTDDLKSIGTHWIALYANDFDSFGVEHIPKEIENFIENKNIPTNIYRIKEND